MTGSTATPGPLTGLRVLDLSQFLAGPFCTQVLGDAGASVVKVEPPDGDSTRHIPPYFVDHDSAYFHSTNRNKESIALNLQDPADLQILMKLISKADVVIENYRPKTRSKLGLDPSAHLANDDQLIWCSISGFGIDGTGVNLPAYDMVVQALAGTMAITGEPGGPPLRTGPPLSDLACGLYAAIAVLQGVIGLRGSSSDDRWLNVSLFDSQVSMLSYVGLYALVGGIEPGPQGAGHMSIPTYQAFICADSRWIVITANTERMWQGLCEALEVDELVNDSRYLTNELRVQHREELLTELRAAFLKWRSSDAVAALQEMDVPAAHVSSVLEALHSELATERGLVEWLERGGAQIPSLTSPIRSQMGQMRTSKPPPKLNSVTVESVLNDWSDLRPSGFHSVEAEC